VGSKRVGQGTRWRAVRRRVSAAKLLGAADHPWLTGDGRAARRAVLHRRLMTGFRFPISRYSPNFAMFAKTPQNPPQRDPQAIKRTGQRITPKRERKRGPAGNTRNIVRWRNGQRLRAEVVSARPERAGRRRVARDKRKRPAPDGGRARGALGAACVGRRVRSEAGVGVVLALGAYGCQTLFGRSRLRGGRRTETDWAFIGLLNSSAMGPFLFQDPALDQTIFRDATRRSMPKPRQERQLL